jgi:hypothetical protein
MADSDAWSGQKADGLRRRAERELKKERRTAAATAARREAEAAARAAEAERRAEARRAWSRAETAENRRRHEAHKEESKKQTPIAGGVTTAWRVTHLQVLGLRPDQDTPKEINRAHRRLALRWHPDKNPSGDAPAQFRRIQAAFEALSKTEGG